MTHHVSPEDRRFRAAFEACEISPSAFDHRAHLRLAYVYLCEQAVDQAQDSMRGALLRLLDHHLGADRSKYHETVTRAWLLAVRHFMARSRPCGSADAFIDAHAELLDAGIMLTHYSRERLFSADARGHFLEPDLAPIPRHAALPAG